MLEAEQEPLGIGRSPSSPSSIPERRILYHPIPHLQSPPPVLHATQPPSLTQPHQHRHSVQPAGTQGRSQFTRTHRRHGCDKHGRKKTACWQAKKLTPAQQYHPITDFPSFYIHPCNTADAMRELLQDRRPSAVEYLMIWLGLVGACVGLHIPQEIAFAIAQSRDS